MKQLKIQKEIKDDYATTEAFNTLKTNLAFCGEQNRVIMVTSTLPGEGKSEVSLYLAHALAENGKKALYLDCDIRKSVMIGKYKIEGVDKALTHYLSGQATMDDIIYSTEYDNMYMVLAGPVAPNPTELLDSEEFRKLVAKVRGEYDYVIVDVPPLGVVIDAAIVGKYVDGAIVVVEQGTIRKRMVINVIKQLKRSNINVLGAVLNKIDETNSSYYSGYYKGYYKEYGEYKN
ncbi:MAG: CpsD/CapB family tyrosine-protein kinase [Anaerostipes sp.]|nr:CpsD/CapB family tyrosine-protein kinase [Anaerostipes sp.]MDD3745788.1 CpsD/CapB family tyrosine-protein kinase [Anaerostipes sp.]